MDANQPSTSKQLGSKNDMKKVSINTTMEKNETADTKVTVIFFTIY